MTASYQPWQSPHAQALPTVTRQLVPPSTRTLSQHPLRRRNLLAHHRLTYPRSITTTPYPTR